MKKSVIFLTIITIICYSTNLKAQTPFYTLQHIRASDDTVMGPITNGSVIITTNATTFNINAIPSTSVGSTTFALSGAITLNRTETSAPYALYGDGGPTSTDFSDGPNLITGSYTLIITAWSSSGGTGTQIAQDTVNFTVIEPTIGNWTLNNQDLYYNGGNVGIGNTSPSYKLDVNGTGRFSSNLIIGDPAGARTEINTSTNHKIFAPTNFKTVDIDGNYHGGGYVGVYRVDNGVHGVYMESQPNNNHNGLFVIEMRPDAVKNSYGVVLYSTVFAGDTTPTNYISLPEQKSVVVIGETGEYKKGQNYGLINKRKTSFEDDVYVETGNVGIGTTTPDEKLAVNGNIHTKEVRVDLIGWSDFVFAKDYELPTLQEVEQYIKEKGHLEDIPSAEEVKENGILLGDMNAKLLQKIEELMLYTIEQQKQINELINQVNALKTKI